MTISSSLAAGVSGLNANAQRLASISDNIANSSTFGYKRTQTDFHSMVIDSGSKSRYTAGGVTTTTQRLIDERGQLQGSNNSTDISIAGRGFLPTTRASAVAQNGDFPLSLMTTGSFRPDDDGVLTDSTGMVLVGWPANREGTFPSFPRDSITGLQPINIFHNQYASNPTTEVRVGLNLPSSDTASLASAEPYDLNLEYFGNLGQTESLNFTYTPTAANTWTMEISDSASGGAIIGEYELEFNNTAVGGGTLKSVTQVSGGAYDPATGSVALTVGAGTLDVNIGFLDEAGGITQLDSAFAPTVLEKNGSSVGRLTGVEIDEGGIVNAIYDSGFTRAIYQVPVIDVANPNGLESGDNQSYTVTRESGELFLWDAGKGPVGETVGYTREASTTDVALELTQMIQTQRAYSTNAKIIQTVDEMLQETANLKR